MPRILIVEDEASVLKAYRQRIELDGTVEVATAETLDEAVRAVENDGPFDAIVLDGCFPHHAGGDPYPAPGRACNGEKFVIWLRGGRVGYKGPILVCSSLPELNRKMLALGATRAVPKGTGVLDAVSELFPPTPAD